MSNALPPTLFFSSASAAAHWPAKRTMLPSARGDMRSSVSLSMPLAGLGLRDLVSTGGGGGELEVAAVS